MTTILRAIIAAAFISITLVACALFPTATPTPVPLPEELTGNWELVRVMVYGAENPPFGTIQVSIQGTDGSIWDEEGTKSNGRAAWSGGCDHHYFTYFLATDSGNIHLGEQIRSQAGCLTLRDGVFTRDPGEQLSTAFYLVSAWAIRDGELWLYTSAGQSNALVFQRVGADPTPAPVPPELTGTWKLAHVVVYGAANPPFGTIQISIHGVSISGDDERSRSNGVAQWSGGCDHHYSADFSATKLYHPTSPVGAFYVNHIDRPRDGCVTTEDGVEIPDAGEQLSNAFEITDSYEFRDGELWLYTCGPLNALVFQRADEEN